MKSLCPHTEAQEGLPGLNGSVSKCQRFQHDDRQIWVLFIVFV